MSGSLKDWALYFPGVVLEFDNDRKCTVLHVGDQAVGAMMKLLDDINQEDLPDEYTRIDPYYLNMLRGSARGIEE